MWPRGTTTLSLGPSAKSALCRSTLEWSLLQRSLGSGFPALGHCLRNANWPNKREVLAFPGRPQNEHPPLCLQHSRDEGASWLRKQWEELFLLEALAHASSCAQHCPFREFAGLRSLEMWLIFNSAVRQRLGAGRSAFVPVAQMVDTSASLTSGHHPKIFHAGGSSKRGGDVRRSRVR